MKITMYKSYYALFSITWFGEKGEEISNMFMHVK